MRRRRAEQVQLHNVGRSLIDLPGGRSIRDLPGKNGSEKAGEDNGVHAIYVKQQCLTVGELIKWCAVQGSMHPQYATDSWIKDLPKTFCYLVIRSYFPDGLPSTTCDYRSGSGNLRFSICSKAKRSEGGTG